MFKRHRSRDNRGVICPLILILISVKKLERSDFDRLARGTIQLLRNVPLLATIVNQNGNRGGLYIRVSCLDSRVRRDIIFRTTDSIDSPTSMNIPTFVIDPYWEPIKQEFRVPST